MTTTLYNSSLVVGVASALTSVAIVEFDSIDATPKATLSAVLLSDLVWFATGFLVIAFGMLTGIIPSRHRLSFFAPPFRGGSGAGSCRACCMPTARLLESDNSPKSSLAEAICAAASSCNDFQVVAIWEAEQVAGQPLPHDALRAVSQALAREKPQAVVGQLSAYVRSLKKVQDPGSNWAPPYIIIDGVARGARRPDLGRQMADAMDMEPEKDARVAEILLGGFAMQGDLRGVEDLLQNLPPAAECKASSAVVRGLARSGLLRAAAASSACGLLRLLRARGLAEG
eukprot:CAMPEP_0204198648 /NCGR_PEP_ID=MMETSP0361-20130328/65436_1 /ASSEMBLY_ACC=CAM_ASM_000343 /TAXON_ID=268821 /ORGANISM="Scrippsiella Hangoei, Strain SHTV-5" /LENGTH=284 /DNA_ID=CAMNT_0051160801 /DNA_START=74 /DNA_END=925 /DNA_ORIENTATION=-